MGLKIESVARQYGRGLAEQMFDEITQKDLPDALRAFNERAAQLLEGRMMWRTYDQEAMDIIRPPKSVLAERGEPGKVPFRSLADLVQDEAGKIDPKELADIEAKRQKMVAELKSNIDGRILVIDRDSLLKVLDRHKDRESPLAFKIRKALLGDRVEGEQRSVKVEVQPKKKAPAKPSKKPLDRFLSRNRKKIINVPKSPRKR